jgi:alpha-maltose-1-phosphate synthase
MKVVLFTREYPPEVYGGAGVHVEYLARELDRLTDVEVRCFGAPRPPDTPGPPVHAFQPWAQLRAMCDEPYASALLTMSADLAMVAGIQDPSLAHSHTWYANFAGHLAKLTFGIPHVMTSHSLEPLRPWKAEQLGPGGYALSSFCERTAIEAADAVIAVSGAMRGDILSCYPGLDAAKIEVIHNGIDPDQYRPDQGTEVLEKYGVDPAAPSVLFVGRITRQKGITHLLDAGLRIDPSAQLVLCAGAPDTDEIARETAEKVQLLRERRGNVVWIDKMVEKWEVIQLLSHATVFVCPSIYEPMGIVNLEAMACETAVVATATGGIPEVVADGETGLLVPFEFRDETTRAPSDPERFAADIAERVNALLSDPERAKQMGKAGRERAVEQFSWRAIAERTLALYRRLVRD